MPTKDSSPKTKTTHSVFRYGAALVFRRTRAMTKLITDSSAQSAAPTRKLVTDRSERSRASAKASLYNDHLNEQAYGGDAD